MAVESRKRPDALRLSDLQKLYMQAYRAFANQDGTQKNTIGFKSG